MTTKVKICGIKTEAALDAALEAGADYVGLVHFPRSPRHVDLATARALSLRAHERSSAKVVALLVDPDDALVDQVVAQVQPDMIQLHGAETPARVGEVRRRARLAVMKAVAVATPEDVANAAAYRGQDAGADFILFDAKPRPEDALPGGNARPFDWSLLETASAQLPFALAGGLTPDTVAEAIRQTGAAIVDVSSGVESAPGEKDAELIRRFLRAAKAANQAHVPSPRSRGEQD